MKTERRWLLPVLVLAMALLITFGAAPGAKAQAQPEPAVVTAKHEMPAQLVLSGTVSAETVRIVNLDEQVAIGGHVMTVREYIATQALIARALLQLLQNAAAQSEPEANPATTNDAGDPLMRTALLTREDASVGHGRGHYQRAKHTAPKVGRSPLLNRRH
jgi:hypothetical protein